MCSIAAATMPALLALILLASTYFKLHGELADNSTVTPTEIAGEEDSGKLESDVWFSELGSFDMGPPWRTFMRPVPPPMGPENNQVVMHCYTWRNKTKQYVIPLHPEIQIAGMPFDAKRSTVIIIHGFKANSTFDWLRKLKDAYLRHVKANVFVADWGKGADCGILQASSNTRVVAKFIVKMLEHLISKRGLNPEKIHLIGHSLGAHVSGYIAKEIPGISRITALDPAQPVFEGCPKEVRLDNADAKFVEVIHTDAKPFIPYFGFGMVHPLGHVDFYFNNGADQPGCTVPDDIPEIHSLRDVMMFPLNYDLNRFTCSHSRAYEYLIEAYNKTTDCVFWGHRATAGVTTVPVGETLGRYSNFTLDSPTCTKETCIPFGLRTVHSPLRGVFVVTTNSHSPFCMTEKGLPKNEYESNTPWH